MNNSFLSVINVVNNGGELNQLSRLYHSIYPVVKNNFQDFEFILINNTHGLPVEATIEKLEEIIKKDIFLINLSTPIQKNNAYLAGLDRANGDYTVIFEFTFIDQPQLILELFEKTKDPFDIVYLKAKKRKSRIKFFYNVFFFILKHYSDLKIDEKAHHTRIISRRALNSLLKLRENLRYMKAIYSLVGYPTSSIEVEEPLRPDPDMGFSERFKTSLVAITSFSSFLRSMLLWIFFFSLVFLILVIINALRVKFFNIDLFGTYHEALTGWTFLVIMLAIFFAITFLNLYIMSIYLSNIYNEIKQRPLYIIESVKRF